MKALTALLIALLLASAVQAKCNNNGLTFWPTSNTILQNSVFVVDGYAESQKIVTDLSSNYKAYLRAGTQRIPLSVQELLVGQFLLTQAVLKPQRTLEVGKRYELVIEDTRNKGRNLAKTWIREAPIYTVVAGTDNTGPTWKVLPKEKTKHYVEWGAGQKCL
jgi:hypothetical protein